MLSGYRICNDKEVQINSFHGQVFLEEKKKKSRTQEMVFGIEIPGKAPDFIYESKPSLCAYVLGKIYCHLFLVFLSTNEALNDTYLEF